VARARSRLAPRPFQSRQRNVSWGGLQIAPTTIVAATKVILGSFVLATQFDETVLRIRGVLSVSSDQEAALERPQCAVGMIVVSEDAFATGIGALPGPTSDIDNDGWFFWQALCGFVDPVGAVGFNYIIDNKGKRIVRQGSRIAVIGEGGVSPVADGNVVWGYLRLLAMFRS